MRSIAGGGQYSWKGYGFRSDMYLEPWEDVDIARFKECWGGGWVKLIAVTLDPYDFSEFRRSVNIFLKGQTLQFMRMHLKYRPIPM
jgi:hypothetical protein